MTLTAFFGIIKVVIYSEICINMEVVKMAKPKVALIMGSDSDFEKLKGCVSKLKEFDIEID